MSEEFDLDPVDTTSGAAESVKVAAEDPTNDSLQVGQPEELSDFAFFGFIFAIALASFLLAVGMINMTVKNQKVKERQAKKNS